MLDGKQLGKALVIGFVIVLATSVIWNDVFWIWGIGGLSFGKVLFVAIAAYIGEKLANVFVK